MDSAGNEIRYRTRSTRHNTEDYNDFQFQTIEGRPAFIETGQSVPFANQNVYRTPDGIVVQDDIEY